MDIREKCLLHTNLKSDQIAALEKMVEHFCFIQEFCGDLTLVVPDKSGKEAVVLFGTPLPDVLSCDTPEMTPWMVLERSGTVQAVEPGSGSFRVVPVYLESDQAMGAVVYRQEANSHEANSQDAGSPDRTLNDLLEFCNRIPPGYPSNYLVPDGIMVVDSGGEIRFANYVAESICRRLDFTGRSIPELVQSLGIRQPAFEAFLSRPAFLGTYLQIEQFDVSVVASPLFNGGQFAGGLVILSDISLIKKKEKELMEKSTVIKEIHHRVKNNLQTITSLLRLQMRRANSRLVEKVFSESINRILSIALIHEALSKQDLEVINVKHTSYNILEMILSNMVEPGKNVKGEIRGSDVYLSPTLASGLSLCVTELIQNAVEHAFVYRTDGTIRVTVEESGQDVLITVEDNGVGVSPAKVQKEGSLGMQIVNTITQHNLKGVFSIEGHRYGTVAQIRFPRFNPEEVES